MALWFTSYGWGTECGLASNIDFNASEFLIAVKKFLFSSPTKWRKTVPYSDEQEELKKQII
jgi:hypothetical protein